MRSSLQNSKCLLNIYNKLVIRKGQHLIGNQTAIHHSSFITDHSPIDWNVVETEAAQLLSRYIQFDTSNPPGNEALAIEFLDDTLRQRGFAPQIFRSAPNRANLVVRLNGQGDIDCAPCLLYAHADVVPADPIAWSMPPFEGYVKDDFVWGRGALDNKGLGIVFMQALTLLRQYASPPKRDIILLIAADEEASGQYGAVWMLNHHPHLIQAEYVWDEGGMALQQANRVLYQIAIAEKSPLIITLTAQGTPGHASIPRKDNPHDRLVEALHRIKQWKHPVRLTPPVIQMLKTLASDQPWPESFLFSHADRPLWQPLLRHYLKSKPLFSPLICNTINLTMLQGGHAGNVIPAQAQATLDVRLLPGQDLEAFLTILRAAISDLYLSVEVKDMPPPQISTPTDTHFYDVLSETLRELGPPGRVIPYLTPGATDSRFFRAAGMKAYGFMPMLLGNTELSRIHGIDERISTANLRWGTQIVYETLKKL